MEDLSFTESLIIILLGLLFFKEELIPWIKQKLGFDSNKANATKGQLNELVEYVNHRQTEILDRQTEILSENRDDIKTLIRKHEEWDRYGMKIRKE